MLGSLTVAALPIDEDDARKEAEKVLGKAVEVQQVSRSRSAVKSEEHPAYYFFNAADGQGFALISGENDEEPLLGYSLKGHLSDTEELPDALKALLDTYEQHVAALRNGETTPTEPAASSNALGIRRAAGAKPLLETEWGQGTPFNNLCPILKDQHCLTGCVATALGQLLYYWKWPVKGTGYASGKDTDGETIHGSLEHEYNWNAMQSTAAGNLASEESALAVAQLLYDCGLAVGMQWGLEGSGAQNPTGALYRNFSYIPTTLRTYVRDAFESDRDYLNIIFNEIDAGRPVYQSAADVGGTGGHAYIIDGYSAEGLVHVNWGWNGTANAYYNITKMNPMNFTYTIRQQIVVGIQPARNGETGTPTAYPYVGEGFSTTQKIGDKLRYSSLSFSISMGNIYNYNGEDHTWIMSVGLFDTKNNLIEVIATGRDGNTEVSLQPGYYRQAGTTATCKLAQKSYADGDYAIRMIFKENDGEWMLPDAAGGLKGNAIYIKLAGKYITFTDGSDYIAAGIDAVNAETGRASFGLYDLLGRKVKSPGKGIYIRNGRKVIY